MPLEYREEFLRKAVRLSEENVRDGAGGPFGAVVVRGGHVIAQGANRVTTDLDPTAHAEVQAIRAACRELGTFQLDGCALYTSCEPCPMCLAAIYWARLDGVFYAGTRLEAAEAGFDDEWLYQEVARPLTERALPMHRHLAAEAREAFRLWREHTDKIPY